MDILVDALPGGEVHVGMIDQWTDEHGENQQRTVSWKMLAENAEELAMLLIDRASSSRTLT